MIRHLRWKVVATNMLLISLVLLAVFAAVFFISRDNYRKNVQQQLYQALEQGDYGISQPGVDSIPCFVAEVYGSGTVRVAGNSYYDLSDETRLADIVTAALHRTADSGTLDEYHLRYLRQTGYATTAIAFTDTYLEYTSLRTLLSACSLVGSVALVVLFLCSYLLSGVVTKPVGAAWAQQEQFLSDASHELKTPLTVILSSADLLRRRAAPEQEAYIDNIQAESRRMRSLVEDMLTLFRAQKSAGTLPDTTADVSETAVTAALRFEPVVFESGRRLLYTIDEGLQVSGDRDALERLTGILLDNAVKYAPQGTDIRLTLTHQDRTACLTVENGGDPIPPEVAAHLFDRFYRADSSRTGTGFGLGLAIARAIAQNHRGNITCRSQEGVNRFSVTLPVLRQKEAQ